MEELIPDYIKSLYNNELIELLYKLSSPIQLLASTIFLMVIKISEKRMFYKIDNLGLNPVFTELDEAYLSLARLPFKNEFRRRTILLWHKIVFDYQKRYAILILKLYKENDPNINEKLRVYAQEILNDMTMALQTSIPPKTERLYSAFAYVARDQLRDTLLYYVSFDKIKPKKKLEAIYRNLVFYCKYTQLVASLQNELNGELTGEYYTDPLTNEVYYA